MKKTIALPQGPILYREVGDGPPVVFVHGLLVDGRVWGRAPDLLAAKGYRCIVPDWPLGAHREPMSPDADLSSHGLAKLIADFLEKLELTGVTLVGNDSGGALSQFVATRHPERLARLVLTTCDAFDHFPPPAFKYLLVAARVPGVMAAMSAFMRALPVMQRLPLAYGNLTHQRIPSELVASWVEPTASSALRGDVAKFLRSIDSKDTHAAAEALKDFRKPVLLAWTPDEKNFPVSLAQRLKEKIPHARLELIEGSLVFVGLDQPEKLATVIADFCAHASLAA